MNSQFDISDTLTNMFGDAMQIPLHSVTEEPAEMPYSGCVHVSGSQNWVLTLDSSRDLAERAAQALLESDDPPSEDELPEIYAELLNVVAGNLSGMEDEAHFTRPVVSTSGPIVVPNARPLFEGKFRDDRGGWLAFAVFPGTA